ncbi:MAG TPA: hypothetical protein VEJ36_01315 [Nitrososphaerales archaeon]|nr:hypothetical protein [Nitrososphaerales archaeon]
MLRVRRRTYAVASASVFAVIFAILGEFPITPLVGISSFLSLREILVPLAGMLFGPLVGGAATVLGVFIDLGPLHQPVALDYLDFVPDLVGAVVAGLAYSGRRREAVALPSALIAVYTLDPLSVNFVTVDGVPIPFAWMHILSVFVLAWALVWESRGKLGRLNPLFIGAVVFCSTMAAHIAGGIVYETVLVNINHAVTPQGLKLDWDAVFYLYPAERVFYTLAGTILSVPVLRALSRSRSGRATAS